MFKRRCVVLGVGLSLLAPLVAPGTGTATSSTDTDPAVAQAVTWLRSKQQPDGGFEQTTFAGFETPDAVLALAEARHDSRSWVPAEARGDVAAITASTGKNPLDYVDDLVEAGDTTTISAAVQAAKVVALVAAPLGVPSNDFDPSNDSASPVDLVARIRAHVRGDGTLDFGSFFNGILYTAIGFQTAGVAVPSGVVGQIRAAQRSDGSWNYAGNQDPSTTGDVDTTSVALLALATTGAGSSDPDVRPGIQFLASTQAPSGAWRSFGSDDPNSTAVAAVALSRLHVDLSNAFWRFVYGAPPADGVYGSPYTWLRSQQVADGHIASPNDAYGLNTFATTQSVQALARQWFLSADRTRVVNAQALRLGSPAASPDTDAAQLASDVLGPNASVQSARSNAAAFVLASSFGREAAAADVFQQALNRTIDPSGLAYWSEKLRTITRSQMLSRITGSSEFYRKAGSTTPTFVDAVYQAVLRRAPDPGGRAYWIAKIDGGDSPTHVAQSLVASTEFRRQTVDAAYLRVVRRAADPRARAYWNDKLATTRVEVLLQTLAASQEFYDGVTGVGAPG